MTARSYGVSPRRRNVLIGAALALTLPLALLGIFAANTGLLVTAALVAAIVVPVFALALRGARLRVTDEGIEVRQLGWNVATPWSNIAALRMRRGAEGFVLHEPLSGKGAERLAAVAGITVSGASFYDAERLELTAAHRFIPIEAFAYWLEHGDLRAVLTERVPALSEPEAWTPPPPQRLSRGRVALITAIIVAALVAGVVLALSPPETQARAERLIAIPVALAIAIYATANVVAALRHLRARRYGWAALWTAMAVVQALIVLAVLAG